MAVHHLTNMVFSITDRSSSSSSSSSTWSFRPFCIYPDGISYYNGSDRMSGKFLCDSVLSESLQIMKVFPLEAANSTPWKLNKNASAIFNNPRAAFEYEQNFLPIPRIAMWSWSMGYQVRSASWYWRLLFEQYVPGLSIGVMTHFR
jgi:hypothetical protein